MLTIPFVFIERETDEAVSIPILDERQASATDAEVS